MQPIQNLDMSLDLLMYRNTDSKPCTENRDLFLGIEIPRHKGLSNSHKTIKHGVKLVRA